MSTHPAIATLSPRSPLTLIHLPTIPPTSTRVLVRVQYTASTPLDLHEADGGLLVSYPHVLGDSAAGTVVEIGADVKRLKVGDRVFGFTWRGREEKAQQEFVTAEEWMFGKVPEPFTLPEAVTLPNNFVTVFHTLVTDLAIHTPWPKPLDYIPDGADSPILIWGGSSSVGQFAIQILKYYGYTNILTTASKKHHESLRELGARMVFDYNDVDVVGQIAKEGGEKGVKVMFDCIGSKYGSIAPISQIAKAGAKVAVLLPVIVRDSTETQDPEYEMDVRRAADWEDGIEVRGVRTHFYPDNEFFKYHLQPEIMPAMLRDGIVKPQKQKKVEGKTMLERAQKALDMLRRKEASMERLVWRVSDE